MLSKSISIWWQNGGFGVAVGAVVDTLSLAFDADRTNLDYAIVQFDPGTSNPFIFVTGNPNTVRLEEEKMTNVSCPSCKATQPSIEAIFVGGELVGW